MKVTCPTCRVEIPPSDINVQMDTALCRSCSSVHLLSGLAGSESAPTVDYTRPPGGAWFNDDGDTMNVGATTRSLAAFIMVPFAAAWSGMSLGGIYGSQIAKGQLNIGMSLFGVPFLLGSIVLWTAALMRIFGKVEVTISGTQGRIFTGIGPVGYIRRFNTDEISSVKDELSNIRINGQQRMGIALRGAKNLVFATMLNDERRHFVTQVLRGILT